MRTASHQLPRPNDRPSAWPRRLAAAGIAGMGLAIASYLGLYQLGIIDTVWEPFFGAGSRVVLRDSWIAHLLPIPDALLGAMLYFVEAVGSLIGNDQRWRAQPWIVLLLGATAAGMVCMGILLAVSQPLLLHSACTLCLASAACSVILAWQMKDEALASLRGVRGAHTRGRSWREALAGAGPSQPAG